MAVYCRKRLKEIYENLEALRQQQQDVVMSNSDAAIGSLQKLVDICEVNDNLFNLK